MNIEASARLFALLLVMILALTSCSPSGTTSDQGGSDYGSFPGGDGSGGVMGSNGSGGHDASYRVARQTCSAYRNSNKNPDTLAAHVAASFVASEKQAAYKGCLDGLR